MKKKEIAERVIRALGSSEFLWRTARGVSKETKIPIQLVQDFLENSSVVLRSRKANKAGRPLYTLRKSYREKASLTSRLIAALRNEAN